MENANTNILPKKERKEMKTKFLVSTVLAFTFVLAACAPKAAATPTRRAAATALVPVTGATATPTKSVKTTPEATKASPTQKPASTPTTPSSQKPSTTPTVGAALINDITVHDQSIQSGAVLVSLVDSIKPGWVAVFTDDNGQPGTLLGYVAVPAGTSSDVKVTIDANKASDKMIAMLLLDAGKVGTFEYPGADQPVTNANVSGNVMAVFSKMGASTH